jgi:excisionase family DNA binding protein
MTERAHLTPGQAADELGVHVSTIIRWADAGLLTHWRTPGGHRRFRTADLRAMSGQVTA